MIKINNKIMYYIFLLYINKTNYCKIMYLLLYILNYDINV